MKKDSALALKKAIKNISEALGPFKQVVEALNAFLVLHNLGTAELEDNPGTILCDYGMGWDFMIFTLDSIPSQAEQGKSFPLLFFHLYTSGKVTGESYVNDDNPEGTWEDGLCSVFRTIGLMNTPEFPNERIKAIIKILGA